MENVIRESIRVIRPTKRSATEWDTMQREEKRPANGQSNTIHSQSQSVLESVLAVSSNIPIRPCLEFE